MELREVMTRDVEVISPESTLVEAARKMREFDVGPIPVCDDNKILGVITDRDIATRAVAEGRDPKLTRVREVMTSDVVYCFEDQPVDEAARLMQERQVRRLLVLNRERELAGIVSLGDIAVDTGDDLMSGETLQRVSENSMHDHARGEHRRDHHYNSSATRSVDARAPQRSDYTQARDLTGRKTVAGLFPDRRSAERAIEELKQAGFSSNQVGLVMRDSLERGRSTEHGKETHAAEGAVTGALGGGVLGGIAGYLVAIGALTIPGIGPVLAGGALAEALGVVAGTAAVAAGIGAAAGGLVGVLVGMGIPEEEARHFERGFGAQEALVTVKAGNRVMEALAIMEMNDADTGVGRRVKK